MDFGSIACKNCGGILDAWTGCKVVAPVRGLCPHCGVDAGINVKIQFSTGIALSSEVSAVAQGTRTGRTVTALDTRRPVVNAAFNAAQAFINALQQIPISESLAIPVAHQEAAAEIERDFVAAVTVGLDREYVRARWLLPDSVDRSQFFRPPPQFVRVGRYNAMGDRVIYLCRNVPTACAETDGGQSRSEQLRYVQKFSIRLPGQRVVCLSRQMEQQYPALNRFLFLSERVPTDRNECSAYRPTHLLRMWAETHGVVAIEFPSVRAGFPIVEEAVNLVAFGETAKRIEAMMIGEPQLI